MDRAISIKGLLRPGPKRRGFKCFRDREALYGQGVIYAQGLIFTGTETAELERDKSLNYMG